MSVVILSPFAGEETGPRRGSTLLWITQHQTQISDSAEPLSAQMMCISSQEGFSAGLRSVLKKFTWSLGCMAVFVDLGLR
jgi:hypothetical protein